MSFLVRNSVKSWNPKSEATETVDAAQIPKAAYYSLPKFARSSLLISGFFRRKCGLSRGVTASARWRVMCCGIRSNRFGNFKVQAPATDQKRQVFWAGFEIREDERLMASRKEPNQSNQTRQTSHDLILAKHKHDPSYAAPILRFWARTIHTSRKEPTERALAER